MIRGHFRRVPTAVKCGWIMGDYLDIVVINASPHGEKSNTMHLTGAFVRGLSAAGECRLKTFDLREYKISQCIGCFSCWRNTPGKCVFVDDTREIFAHMIAADVVIWSFPLYFFGVPAKMKALIERQLPLMSPMMGGNEDVLVNGGHKFRFDAGIKKNVLISTCGFYYAPSTYDGVTGQFDMIYGPGGYEKILIGEGELFNKPYLKKKLDAYLVHIEQAGREYAAGGITTETRANIEKGLYPTKFYAEIADRSWGVTEKDFIPADEELLARVKNIKHNTNTH